MKKLFVFDYDDTIRPCVHDYDKAILEVPKIIVAALGPRAPHARKIINLAAEVDYQRINEINPNAGKPFLYSMERFPGSCVETYRIICAQLDVNPDPAVEELLYQTGMTAFDENRYRQDIDPGAKEVLDFLSAQDDVLVLLTKGDPWVQENKLRALREAGLDYFTKVLIVDDKTPAMFRQIAAGFEDASPISVGNSFKSDIAPALEVGYFGIHIPLTTWEDLEHKTKIDWWQRLWERLSNLFPRKRKEEEQYIQLSSLREIITEYGRLP